MLVRYVLSILAPVLTMYSACNSSVHHPSPPVSSFKTYLMGELMNSVKKCLQWTCQICSEGIGEFFLKAFAMDLLGKLQVN